MQLLRGPADRRGSPAADHQGAADSHDQSARRGARGHRAADHQDGVQRVPGIEESGESDHGEGDPHADDQCDIREDGDSGGERALVLSPPGLSKMLTVYFIYFFFSCHAIDRLF